MAVYNQSWHRSPQASGGRVSGGWGGATTSLQRTLVSEQKDRLGHRLYLECGV